MGGGDPRGDDGGLAHPGNTEPAHRRRQRDAEVVGVRSGEALVHVARGDQGDDHGATTSGSVKQNTLPVPPPGDGSTQMRPWWRSTIFWHTAWPRPVPG